MNRPTRWTAIAARRSRAALLAASCGGSSSSERSHVRASPSRARRSPCSCPTRCRRSCSTSSPPRPASRSTTSGSGWDATHNKLLVANTAKTYIADVAEFDWSFTGQFAGAGWVEPLDNLLPVSGVVPERQG